jgi:hypothetical protein
VPLFDLRPLEFIVAEKAILEPNQVCRGPNCLCPELQNRVGVLFCLARRRQTLAVGPAGTPVTTFVGDADPDPHPVDIRMSISRHGPGLIAILPRPDAKQYRAPIRNCSRRCRRLWP